MRPLPYILMLLPLFFLYIYLPGQPAESSLPNLSIVEQIPSQDPPTLADYFFLNYHDENSLLTIPETDYEISPPPLKTPTGKNFLQTGKIQLVSSDYNEFKSGLSLGNPYHAAGTDVSSDTVVQLNVINVFGFYLDIVAINPDSTSAGKKDSGFYKTTYASLNTGIFIPDDFERKYGRPYYELSSATGNALTGSSYFYHFRNNVALNNISLSATGISSAFFSGPEGSGGISVRGSFNNLRISQR